MPAEGNLLHLHDSVDNVEKKLRGLLGCQAVIHMDPVEINDQKVLDKKNMIIALVAELEPKANVHDFRVVNGEHAVNLIFDLVVPFAYKESDECELLEKITQKVEQIDPRYHCVATIEKNFVSGL